MILADDIVEGVPQAGILFRDCRVLRLHNDVYEMALELVAHSKPGHIEKIAKFVCWPDYNTWIECSTPSGDFGFMFMSEDDSVVAGSGLMVVRPKGPDRGAIQTIPVIFDLPHYELGFMDAKAQARQALQKNRQAAMAFIRHMDDGQHGLKWYLDDLDKHEDPLLTRMVHEPLLLAWKPILFALLALINSPKLIHTREVDVSKLNKHRLKKGRYPFHPHHEVRINVDRHDHTVTPPTGRGPEREQYFVRAHPRFFLHPRYKNVEVILVKPHYRGNPELGMRNTSYRADRKQSRW